MAFSHPPHFMLEYSGFGTDTFWFVDAGGEKGLGADTDCISLAGGENGFGVSGLGLASALEGIVMLGLVAGGNGFPLESEASNGSCRPALGFRAKFAGLALTGGEGLASVLIIPTASVNFCALLVTES